MGGKRLLQSKYNGSPSLLLSTVYPEYDWLPWKFGKCTHNFWDELKNRRKFMDWAAKELEVNEMRGWYKVTNQAIPINW
jgi:hypothetical protein